MKKPKNHPAADVFPINEEDVERLAVSIKEQGQLEPIRLTADGLILDGRNRWLACEKAGVDPRTETLPEMDEAALYDLAWALNGDRRDLSKTQRATAAAETLKRMKELGKLKPGPKKGNVAEICNDSKPNDRMAVQFKVNHDMIRQAREILEDPKSKDLFALLKRGEETISSVYPAWKAEQDRQNQALKDTQKPKLRALRAKAPDLADQVEAGALTYDNALKELARREAEKEARAKFLTEKYSSLTMIVTMARTMKKELTPDEWREAVELRPAFIRERDLKDISETFETLTSLRDLITSIPTNP